MESTSLGGGVVPLGQPQRIATVTRTCARISISPASTGVDASAAIRIIARSGMGCGPPPTNCSSMRRMRSIARVEVGRIYGLVFALKQLGGISSNPAKHLAVGVNHMPFGRQSLHGWYVSWHRGTVPYYLLQREDGKPKSYRGFGSNAIHARAIQAR